VPREQRLRLLLAFASVWIIWGSTYLAIRYAIETIPPFTMAALRFVVAGTLLMVGARLRGAAWPAAVEWRTAAVIGTLLLLGGNGGVVWSEQRVPSSLAALIVAAVPLVTAAMDWMRKGGTRPTRLTIAGLVIGFGGVALLINPGAHDAARVDPLGTIALLIAIVSWSFGSIYARGARIAASPLMAAGANMLMGSVGLAGAALLSGELGRLHPGAVSARSLVALLYLIGFGAVVGFTAYYWLLRNTTTVKATTYAYVNPVVAILLGWAIAGEPLTPRVLAAAGVILAGVATITTAPYLRARYVARGMAAAGGD